MILATLFVAAVLLIADIGAPVPPATPAPAPAPAVNSSIPPRPAGEGWQYDAVRGHWWRLSPPPIAYTPNWGVPVPQSPYRSNPFQYAPTLFGGCPNGQCPKR